MQTETAKRIGVAVLKVIVRHALESLPVVGASFKLSFEAIGAAKKELEKEQHLKVTEKEIGDALHSLSHSEATEAIDSELKAAEGSAFTERLNPEEREEVRRRLLEIPKEFDGLLARIESREREAAQAAALEERRKLEERFEQLRTKLRPALEGGLYQEAHNVVEEMLAINPRDRELLKIEAFTNKRIPQGWGCGAISLLALAYLFILLILAEGFFPGLVDDAKGKVFALALGVMVLYHLVIEPTVLPWTPRVIRKSLGLWILVAFTALVTGLLFAARRW